MWRFWAVLFLSLLATTLGAQRLAFPDSGGCKELSYQNLGTVVPCPGLPARVVPQRSNNNVDLVWFRDRYFMAFRTGPTHFPGRKVWMYVVSSKDMVNWEFETSLHLNADIREPRFAILHDQLWLYCVELEGFMFKFNPQQLWALQRTGPGLWAQTTIPSLAGYVPWRIRKHGNSLLLSAYHGVGLYKASHQGQQRLFESTDGLHWKPLTDAPQVSMHGAEEGEFILDGQGALWGTLRLEGGGGAIVTAPADALGQWKLKLLDEKYDSALLFDYKDDIYLVARRNLDGPSDSAPKGWGPKLRHAYNLVRYSLTKKRTAIYKLDKQTLKLVHLFDLPSTGDTAFAGIAPAGPDSFYLVNYSNNVNGRDGSWLKGQLSRSYLYLFKLQMRY